MKDLPVDKLVMTEVTEAELLEFHGNRVMDPVESKMYDLKKSPPPAGEIADRGVKRDQDQEDKVKETLAPYFSQIDGIVAAWDAAKIMKVKGTTNSGGEEE